MTDGCREIERVARLSYGRLVAIPSARLRSPQAAEEPLGESLLAALERWPRTGVPDNPKRWLLMVAGRKAVDALRRDGTRRNLESEVVRMTGRDQGFESLLANGGIDPINVFPYGLEDPNYSPLWDAHVSQWTEAAVAEGQVRRIASFNDLAAMIEAGQVESAFINPEGPGNDCLFGLRPTRVVINGPVIAHPDESVVLR